MMRQLRRLGAILATTTAMASAQDLELDVWHHITTDSPFYAENLAGLQGAAILQADGRFAMLVLGAPGEGALVSVTMQMAEPASQLTSTLVTPAGGIFVRTVDETQFLADIAPDGTAVTYSFGIAPDDVDQFMSAELWRVQAGDRLATITLNGSHDAITEAIRARATDPEEDQTADP